MIRAGGAARGPNDGQGHGRGYHPRPEVLIETALGLLAVALLIGANAFFVAAEFAFVTVDRERIEVMAREGDRRARRTRGLLQRLSFNLSGAQLGITVTSLVVGFIAEPTVARALEPAFGWLPETSRDGVSLAVALALATVAQMLFGELVPKGLAIAHPLPTALAVAGPSRIYGVVFGPLIRFLNGAADWTVRRLGIEPREELQAVRSLEELKLLIRSSGEEGALDADAYNLLARTIRFGDKTVADALVPRLDVRSLPATASAADLAALAVETGHSRFPVVGDGLDDIVGVVHAKDVLRVRSDERDRTPLTALASPARFVPEGRDLESLLGELRGEGAHLAVVLDEFGSVAGVVTLEDLLEEIVGEIEDEHDPAGSTTGPLPEGTFVVIGTLHLDEVAEATGFHVPEGPYETLAGFMLDRLGHLPEPGEKVEHAGWHLEVVEMDRRRVAAVRLVAPASTTTASPDTDANGSGGSR